MLVSAAWALHWSEKLLALALALQTIELLLIHRVTAPNGIWDWSIIRRELENFPRPIRSVLDALLDYPNFIGLLLLQLGAAFLLGINSSALCLVGLFFSTLLISMRWRGVFNGGSDYMTLIILSALSVAALFSAYSQVAYGALWYIAIHCCSSYFISGVIKLRKENWRRGRALPVFVSQGIYPAPERISELLANKGLARVASWGIIAFECSFPLALLSPEVCLVLVLLALVFHLANFYIFGLNRFLFIWLAAYPALLFCSGI